MEAEGLLFKVKDVKAIRGRVKVMRSIAGAMEYNSYITNCMKWE